MKISDYLDRFADELERLDQVGRAKRVKTLLPELNDPETRQALAEVILVQFERWGVSEFNYALLLGLPETSELKQGDTIPDVVVVLERVGHLLAIDRALLKRYPNQADYGEDWLASPEPRLGNRKPLEFMLVGGLQAIKEVQAIVESDVKALHLERV